MPGSGSHTKGTHVHFCLFVAATACTWATTGVSFFSDIHDYFNKGDKGKEKNPKILILFASFYYIRFLFSF